MPTLSEYLERHRLTEAAFSRMAGIAQPTINRLRRGERRPSADLARRIERATRGEVSAASLLGVADGVGESSALDLQDGRWSLTLDDTGAGVLNSAMTASLGFGPGERLVFRPGSDGVLVTSVQQTLRELRAKFAGRVAPGVSVVDELIAERRAEAARE